MQGSEGFFIAGFPMLNVVRYRHRPAGTRMAGQPDKGDAGGQKNTPTSAAGVFFDVSGVFSALPAAGDRFHHSKKHTGAHKDKCLGQNLVL